MTFSKQPQIDIPSLDMYNHNFDSIIANDKAAHLNFSRVAQAAKQKQKIYQSLSEPILDGKLSYTLDYTSPLAIMTYISFIMSFITLIAVAFISYPLVKMLYLALPLASTQLPSTDASPIFSYNTLPPMFTTTPQTTCTQPVLDYILLTLSLLSAIVFCCIYIRKRLQQRNHTSLNIELSNGSICTMVKVIDLPLCPRYWHFQANKYISDVSITGYFLPKMLIKWEGLKITNQITKTEILPPQEIAINWVQAFLDYQIIKGPFCAFSVLKHHNQGFHFLICPMDCTRCYSPTNNQTQKISPTLPN